MLFFGIKNAWFRTGIFLIVAAWAALAIYWMHRNYYVIDPPDASLTGTARYGRNDEGGFQSFSILILIESLILLATLLPYSFSRLYWIRLLILQMIGGGWFFLLVLAAMHNSGVYMIHLLAILAINIIIFILLIASVIAEIGNRNKPNLLV